MHDEHRAAGLRNRIDEAHQEFIGVRRGVRHRLDADATLHRNRNLHGRAHRADAFGDQRRLGHQARAEPAALHAIARAAAIEIDLVITELRADARSLGQLVRIAAAELERDRMLRGMEFAAGVQRRHARSQPR